MFSALCHKDLIVVRSMVATPDFGRFPLTRLTGSVAGLLHQTGLVSANKVVFDRPDGRTGFIDRG